MLFTNFFLFLQVSFAGFSYILAEHSGSHAPKMYHCPRRAPRVLETLGIHLSKRLIYRFLRSSGHRSPHDAYFLANMQIFLLEIAVAQASVL